MASPTRRAVVIICVAAAAAAFGADKYAGDWMTYGAGARALAMGSAFVAVADDGSAPYWNPAGMPAIERGAVSAMHSYAFNGLATYDSVFGAYNAGRWGALGGGMLRSGIDDIPITVWDDANSPTRRPVRKGYANWADYAFYLSYGRPVLPWLRVGGSGIIIVGDHLSGLVDDAGSSGQALDVAALAGPFGPVTVGVNFQNVYSRLRWDTGTVETMPANAKVGAAYRFVVPTWDSEFTLAAGGDVKFAGYDYAAQLGAGRASFDFSGGAEWWYKRTVAVRLGSERSALAGGVGLAARALGMTFGIDYAYLSDTGLESSHRASVSAAF